MSDQSPLEAQLAKRIERLTVRVLDDLEWQMVNAPPAARRDLLKSVIPALFKDKEASGDELAEMREQLDELHAATRGELYATPATAVEKQPEPTAIPTLPTIPTDTP
jgi:hypothetical protein